MKIRFVLLPIFFSAFVLACAKMPPSISSVAKPDTIVLEITTDARGMVYPKEGELLNFRLYESGRFEYDDYPAQDPETGAIAGKVIITRKESKLSADDVNELINLAEQPDFFAAKDAYSGLRQHVDDHWETTITFTHQNIKKKIAAVDFWDLADYQEDRAQYPVSMVKLLDRVRQLKTQALGKH